MFPCAPEGDEKCSHRATGVRARVGRNVSLEFYVVVQLLIDMRQRRAGERRSRPKSSLYAVARNNVVSRSLFYRPIYYNQKKAQSRGCLSRALASATREGLVPRIVISLLEPDKACAPLAFIARALRTLLHFFECDLSWNNFFCSSRRFSLLARLHNLRPAPR